VPVIVGPTSHFGVEPINQIGGGHAQRSFEVSPETIQKGLDILFGRLDEQFPVGILAHVLSEEIKTLLHNTTNERGRNAGLPIGWKRKRLFEATQTEITPLSTSADGFVLVVSSSSTRYEFRLPR
jgi:hypothetical protein